MSVNHNVLRFFFSHFLRLMTAGLCVSVLLACSGPELSEDSLGSRPPSVSVPRKAPTPSLTAPSDITDMQQTVDNTPTFTIDISRIRATVENANIDVFFVLKQGTKEIQKHSGRNIDTWTPRALELGSYVLYTYTQFTPTETLDSVLVQGFASPRRQYAFDVKFSLSGSGDSTSVILTWTAFSDAAMYNIYQDGTQIHTTPDGTTNSYTISSGLTDGATYTFKVVIVGGNADSKENEVKVTPVTAPTGLSATARVEEVELRWTVSSSAAVTGYKVEQTVDGNAAEIDVAGRATGTYIVRDLVGGKSYSYRIAAFVGSTNTRGSRSSAAAATPIFSAPIGLTAVPGNGQVTLSWSSVRGATTYRVYQGLTATSTTALPTDSTNVSRVVTGLSNGVTYYFQVSAATASARRSTAVSATPAP